jgi:acetyltransferase
MLSKPEEHAVNLADVDDDAVARVIARVEAEGRINLSSEEAFEIASAYRIPVPEARMARDAEEAREIAESIGCPVAVKIVSPDILHKTDMGCVILNVKTSEEAGGAYELVTRRARAAMPQARILGALIQKMAPPGREVIVGSVRDPQFGPLVMFGLGGIYVNFLRDVSYRLAPLTFTEATEMVSETKAYTLLKGVRGEPPADLESVLNVVVRLSQLMCRFKKLVEMEINPLFAYDEGKGCMAVDIRGTLSKPKGEAET